MDLETMRILLSPLPHTREDFPFGPEPLVLKVGDKMFALISIDENPLRVSLKVDPEDSIYLQQQFSNIKPGYHLDKRHWITVILDDSMDDDFFIRLVYNSYKLVVKGLPAILRNDILPRLE